MNWSRFQRARGKAVVVLVTVCVLAAGVTAAFGTHVDSMFKTQNFNPDCHDDSGGPDANDHFCQTDNATLTVWRASSLSATGKNNIASSLNGKYNPTDLNVSYVSSPSTSGSAETDIIYEAGDPPGSNIGITWCNDAVSSTKCDQHYVLFSDPSIQESYACHETGHAVGLTHGHEAYPRLDNLDSSLGCMTNPPYTTALGTHNTQMINATYPN
jgi:hypothetical protein